MTKNELNSKALENLTKSANFYLQARKIDISNTIYAYEDQDDIEDDNEYESGIGGFEEAEGFNHIDFLVKTAKNLFK